MMANRWLWGCALAIGSFLIIGTMTALWPNPLFIRMTPVDGYEFPILAAQSGLLGVFVAVRRPHCKISVTGIGSLASFLGVACPICNKLLVLLFTANALLTHFEPIRWLFGVVGVALTAAAVLWELRSQRRELKSPLAGNEACPIARTSR